MESKETASKMLSVEETHVTKRKLLLKLYISVLSSPPMILFLLSQLLLNLGITAFFAFTPDRAIKSGGLSKSESSILLSIIGVC